MVFRKNILKHEQYQDVKWFHGKSLIRKCLFTFKITLMINKRPKGINGHLHIVLFVHVSAWTTVSTPRGVRPFSSINSDPNH